jgi:hypothetical protein
MMRAATCQKVQAFLINRDRTITAHRQGTGKDQAQKGRQ